MDPAVFMGGEFNPYTLGYYLGYPPSSPEAAKQGRKLLELYGVLPSRDTVANCPSCRSLLHTVRDSERFGWRYCCENHVKRLRFSPLLNTFLSKVRLRGEMTTDKVLKLIQMWCDRQPLIKVLQYLHLSAESAVYWYGHCREIACAIAWHDYIPIGGDKDVVEVHDSLLFKKQLNVRGRKTYKHIRLVGGISRVTKKRFALVVPSDIMSSDKLLPILHQCIDDKSYVCTSNSPAYEECEKIFNGHGWTDDFVYPPKGQSPMWMPTGRFSRECLDLKWSRPPSTPELQPFRISVQNMKRAWRDLKSLTKSSFVEEHLDAYLGEWLYRKNVLGEIEGEKEKFERFLRDRRRVYPGVGKKAMRVRYEDIMDCDCHECQPNGN
ncbi:hypothetical protein NQ318_010479 [Aromia moschata]|uniref:Transposase n=1 Tax=Aromia moschata TaxID=1265417 RepID=A0AAV8YBQ1_9CUCU|nr:hypothetical protein NQ318_010479 [Aromia moschata]